MERHYDDGLRFSCTGCRYCCGVEPGYVFLTHDDVDRLAAFFHLEPACFIETYCRKVPMGGISYVSLKEKARNDCEFLESYGCSVYEARPLQCRTYPFWSGIVASKQAWDDEARSCPGIGTGRLYSRTEIEKMVRSRELQEPMIVADDAR